MLLSRLSAGLFGALISLSVAAQSPPQPTSQQIEDAKALGAAASGQAKSQALQVDSTGQPVLGSDGKPLMQETSTNSLRDSLRMFQDTSGLQSLEQVASPGNGGRTGLAKIGVTGQFDFVCKSAANSVFSAGSLAFKLGACESQNNAVSTVSARLCDNATRAGTCSSDSDYGDSFRLAANQFSQLGDLQMGVACNSQKTCRITVKGTYTVGGNDASMKTDARTAAQQATDGSVISQLRTAVIQGDYAGQMTDIGKPLQACAAANANAMSTGTASTCDGQQTVTVATQQNQAKCTGTRQCLHEAISVQTFTRKCTRTFPLTERISRVQYKNTATCTIAETRQPKGDFATTDSCAATPAGDPRSGMTKVGALARACSSTVTESDVEVCIAYSTTEYWANVAVSTLLGQSASPSAVAGACDTSPLSETRYSSCENGNWFGRTSPLSDCSVAVFDEATNQSGITGAELNYAERAGCGFCLTPAVGETCYGQPSVTDDVDSCAGMALDSCTLTSTAPRSYTGNGGLVSSQEETYACRKETKSCTAYSSASDENGCLSSDMALGLDKAKPGPSTADGSLNSALVAAAVLDSTARGSEGQQSQAIPLIFSGADMRCGRATGGIGQLFGRNCCRTDLERPVAGQLTRGGCNMDEAKLAAARRSSYAHFIGDYCSKRMFFPRRCLERKETYCVFQGILPRLVQEQGRDQLAALTASSANSQIEQASLGFSYYDNASGSWSTPVSANGVTVAAWQWPSYCANPELAQQKLLAEPDAKSCPGVVSTYVATCELSTGCGSLPAQPEDGAASWQLHVLNPLENITTATSRFATMTGACSTQTKRCQYTLSAWPAGVGGKAVVSHDLNWSLYSNQTTPNSGQAPEVYQMNNIGDLMFKGFSVPGMATGGLPSTVRLDFSRDGGQTWTTHQLPTNQQKGDFALPNSDVKLSGYCDGATNSCGYRITGTTVVTAKTWGSAENPDCSGFTAGQLSAFDFGKMDLSEWLSSVMSKVATRTNTELVQAANQQFQAFNSVFSQGAVSQAKPTSANFARMVPSEGFGPFSGKLVVSGNWPETTGDATVDKDKVTQVFVKWGDCSADEQVAPVPLDQGNGFATRHTFPAPDSLACLGNPHQNVTHQVELTVYTTLSGVQKRTLKVENAWATFPGGTQNNDNVGQRVTVPANGGDTTPPPPKP